MQISKQSTTSPHSREEPLPEAPAGPVAAKEKLSLPATVAGKFAKLEIALRTRLLGRLLASVGPLALKVVGGGAFAKYVRHARSPEIPVTFADAASATSSEVRALVHYVEQSNPDLVEELSTSLSLNDAATAPPPASIVHRDRAPPVTQEPSRRAVGHQHLSTHELARASQSTRPIESEDSPPGPRFRRRALHDY